MLPSRRKPTGCWFDGRGAGACDGRLVKAHLIPKQRIKREFPLGVWWAPGELLKVLRASRSDTVLVVVRSARWEVGHTLAGVTPEQLDVEPLSLEAIVWDPECWVPMCGGPCGVSGHHGMFDGRQLVVARAELPACVEHFAEEFGLGWSLDADYGPLEVAA